MGDDRKSCTIVRPIVYGNITKYLPEKKENGHTHQWTLYLRPYYQEDGSKWIKKVSFKLHESYNNPVRVRDCAPFCIEETGWGQFEVTIRVYFTDPNEKSVVIYHWLTLFSTDENIQKGRKPLVAEQYDEIVFQDPTFTMYRALTPFPKSVDKHNIDFATKEHRTKELIKNAKREVTKEIENLRVALTEAQDLREKFCGKLREIQEGTQIDHQ